MVKKNVIEQLIQVKKMYLVHNVLIILLQKRKNNQQKKVVKKVDKIFI